MEFREAYKRLEGICYDIYGERRLTPYIEDMKSCKSYRFLPDGWKNDLDKLIHYRKIRNKCSHEPGCREEDMTDSSDSLWLESFYSRLINRTDPLALYRKNEADTHNMITNTTIKNNDKSQYKYKKSAEPFEDYEKDIGVPGIVALVVIAISVIIIIGTVLYNGLL